MTRLVDGSSQERLNYYFSYSKQKDRNHFVSTLRRNYDENYFSICSRCPYVLSMIIVGMIGWFGRPCGCSPRSLTASREAFDSPHIHFPNGSSHITQSVPLDGSQEMPCTGGALMILVRLCGLIGDGLIKHVKWTASEWSVRLESHILSKNFPVKCNAGTVIWPRRGNIQ